MIINNGYCQCRTKIPEKRIVARHLLLCFVVLAALTLYAKSILAADGINSSSGTTLPIGAGGNTALWITPSGYVGIGTANPFNMLTVQGEVPSLLLRSSYESENGGGNAGWRVARQTSGDEGWTSSGLNFAEAGQADGRMFLEDGGNIGIGTMHPAIKLHVIGGAYFDATAAWPANGVTASSLVNGIYAATSSAGASGGYFINNSTGCYGYIANNSYSAGGNCTTNFASDVRLKKKIRPVQNGLDAIMKLRPVSYLWRTDGKNHYLTTDKSKKAVNYGFIAQDVMRVLPDIVTETPTEMQMPSKSGELPAKSEKSETMYGLDYNGFIAPTIKAVQELNETLIKLKTENDNLRARVEKLEARGQ
jgi:hypothetical protein